MLTNGFDASAISERPMLLVATTRKPVNGARAKPWFGPERASTMNVARAKLAPNDHEALCVRVRQRAQQHGVDHAEDRGAGADAERDRHGGDRGEPQVLAQSARGVGEIS